ncbi:Transcriptional regulator, LysR family, partial [Pseudomonas syringae pv. coryli]
MPFFDRCCCAARACIRTASTGVLSGRCKSLPLGMRNGLSKPSSIVREDLMNLESKWLEDFSALAATRSFSQAAERRFVTQPAFSRRIRSLESALGLTLVNRSRTPIELTAAGQLFLVTARTVVEQLGEVVRHLH